MAGSALRSNHQMGLRGIRANNADEKSSLEEVSVVPTERPRSAPNRTPIQDITASTSQGKQNNAVMSAVAASLHRPQENTGRFWVPIGVRAAGLHKRAEEKIIPAAMEIERSSLVRREASEERLTLEDGSPPPPQSPQQSPRSPKAKAKPKFLAMKPPPVVVEKSSIPDDRVDLAGNEGRAAFVPPTGPQIGNPGHPNSPEHSFNRKTDTFESPSVDSIDAVLGRERLHTDGASTNGSKERVRFYADRYATEDSTATTIAPQPSHPDLPQEDKVEGVAQDDGTLATIEAPGAIIPHDMGDGICAKTLPGSLHSYRLPRQVMKGQHYASMKRPVSANSRSRPQRPHSARERPSGQKVSNITGIRARSALTNLAGSAAARSMRRVAAGRGEDLLVDPLVLTSKGPPASRAQIEDLKIKAGRRVLYQTKFVNIAI
eukprot:gnl/MRDRNA2_/MRDRNA2_115638_c0_seq1.p1 gnl/MRDRNA2_/MRDRNA2_115638_c0~~gnl/MRDRNA2_/MRDRNA2_115638_c0_seq1.p1  ORF type:complete len:432 (-),score=60.50 gnl/MRDRNA2_/MRDRNA2_115638_c0_seq1:113-1408(-)